MRIPNIPADRSIRLLLLGVAAASVLFVSSWHRMASSRCAAIRSSEQYRQCRRLAERIRVLKDRPLRASDSLQTATQLARALEEAAQSVKIELDQLIRIDSRPARQIENTPYQEQPTYFEVRGVTLEQLVAFLHKLATENHGTEVVDLRLSSPRSGGIYAKDTQDCASTETWDAEVTLTSLVFNP